MIKILQLSIWGRDFTLPVEYDCYAGEKVTRRQISSVKAFSAHSEWVENSKSLVEDYCKDQVMDDEENEKKDNIFSYVIPEYIFVKREKDPRIALVCKYRYDPEHGLMVVYSSDGDAIVGSQDMVL